MTTEQRSEPILTTGKIAYFLRCAPRTVSKWFDAGKLKGYRIPSTTRGIGDRRIRHSDFVRFCEENGLPSPGPAPRSVVVAVGLPAGWLPGADDLTLFGLAAELARPNRIGPSLSAVVFGCDYGRAAAFDAIRQVAEVDPGIKLAVVVGDDLDPAEVPLPSVDGFRLSDGPSPVVEWIDANT